MGWEIIPPSALIMTFIGAIPVAIYGVHYLFYPDQVRLPAPAIALDLMLVQPRRVSQNAFSLAMESRDSRILHWIKVHHLALAAEGVFLSHMKDAKRIEKQQGK